MTKPYPIFCTPSLGHHVSLAYLQSWSKTSWLLKEAGISFGRIDKGGDCFIDKVRNKFVQDFLDGEGTDLFFLDDDLGWTPEKVLEFVLRPEPLLAGIYPKKMDDLDFPVALDASVETGELITDQGLYLATFAGAGFLKIKREVLEKLVPLVPRFKDMEYGGIVKGYPYLFQTGINKDGFYEGEDVAFLRMARAAGYDLWVDPTVEFRHQGLKTWHGKLSDHLETFRQKGMLAMAKQRAAE